MLFVIATVGLCGWFGYLSFSGTEFTGSIYDRAMNSFGVIISEINVPVLQLIAAALIVIAWPKKWQFKSAPPQAVSAQQPV